MKILICDGIFQKNDFFFYHFKVNFDNQYHLYGKLLVSSGALDNLIQCKRLYFLSKNGFSRINTPYQICKP